MTTETQQPNEHGTPGREASECGELLADDAKIYPCTDCGTMRSKAEGGTTFTVCDECWKKHYNPVN